MHCLDGSGKFALQRPTALNVLVKFGQRQIIAAIEDLVADAAGGWQSFLCQQRPCCEHIVGGDHDALAVRLDPVGDLMMLQLVDNLLRVVQIEVAVQQHHAGCADAAQFQECNNTDHADQHAGQRQDRRHAQLAQAVEKTLHDFCSGTGIALPL